MIILPLQCSKSSRKVEDIKDIKPLIEEMVELCKAPVGKKTGGLALAHCQVDHDNPKRFFVFANGDVVINPVILAKALPTVSVEGCMSYPFRGDKKVKRHDIVDARYLNEKGKEITKTVSGLDAFIFQHEIDHMNGLSVYTK